MKLQKVAQIDPSNSIYDEYMNKIELRQLIRSKRQQLAMSVQKQAAQKVAARLNEIVAFNQGQHIACYLSVKGELDTAPIIDAIWQSGKICYLPVLDPKSPRSLCFVRYLKDDVLVNNHYAIPEPVMENNVIIAPKDLDVVFMPLVAFDAQGNRLGQGAGYYDRTFSFKLGKEASVTPMLIGVAYEWQKVLALDVSSWDVPLQMVITEDNCYSCL